MIRLLLFYVSYCVAPHALRHLAIGSYMLDHAEPEPGVQAEQPQAEGLTNLVWIKASPGKSNQCPCLLF
jgi:hypothetical protein